MNYDIEHILDNWPFEPDSDMPVRIIKGRGGLKIQMRIDMGIIQMDMDRSPSGERPNGYETWFHYYQHQQKEFDKSRIDDFFVLTENDCIKLQREATHFYYRYLSLMKLGDYPRVIRDTERNLAVFNFVKQYASTEMDRWALDQYRPYVLMINSRAKASLAIENEPLDGIRHAIEHLESGINKIHAFYKEYGLESEIDNSFELSILEALKKEFLKNVPQTPEDRLSEAIKDERFEDAAIIRDEIRRMKNENSAKTKKK